MNASAPPTRSIPGQKAKFPEFIVLMALCMSLVALSIDAMLPALPDIVRHYAVTRPNSGQFVITALFAGLALGQLLAGPLSDSLGRKKAIYIGLVLFALGCLLSYGAPDFRTMLAGRFIQGLGVAAPRIVTVAIIRDLYEGREMARVMSFIMGIFILVPAMAPTIGQGIIMLAGWQAIYPVFMAIAALSCLWLSARLEETLRPEDVRPFSWPVIWSGIKTVCGHRATICCTIAAGCIFGAFIGYLNSSQAIFQEYFAAGDKFPLYFGITALALGAAFFVNAWLVKTYGMRKVIVRALVAMAILAALFLTFEIAVQGKVPLLAFMAFIMGSAFCMGMLFGNFNALAMEPMGHLAGMASAVIGCVSLAVALSAGILIGQLYDENLMPVTLGFLILAIASLCLMRMAGKA